MKENAQKTKQLSRTIQGSGRNQKVGFVDNRNNILVQRKQVVQRITEEDARQATFNFGNRANAHGYSNEYLQYIMQRRFGEIQVGTGMSMLIGQGTEEGYGTYGQILYNCTLVGDTYKIYIYHAHGQGKMG